MRHRKTNTSSFGLKAGPRKALLRSLVVSLSEKERIKTTLPRAKRVRSLIEKAITLGKKDTVHARRLLFSRYPNKDTVSQIIKISERFKDRKGGYTRIVKLGFRPGDQAPKALIEFVDYVFKPKLSKEEKEKLNASKEFIKEKAKFQRKRDKKRKHKSQIQKSSRKTNRD